LEVVRVEIRVRLKGGKIAVYVRSDDPRWHGFLRGRGEVLKAEKDIDSLGIDLKSLAGRFREGYDYSVRWFVREVKRLVESKLWKVIGTMCIEAITDPDLNPAVYPVYICNAWLLEEVANEEIHVGYTTSVLRFKKCFAIKNYSDAYILPYDVSKINLEKTDEKSIRIYENVYYLIKDIRTKHDIPDDIGGVMDYYMFLYESLGVR
jgi:hypothetical protein